GFLASRILQPAAWLYFLVTFVRLPEPPLRPTSRRGAFWLAVTGLPAGVLPIWIFAGSVVMFFWTYPTNSGGFPTWNSLIASLMNVMQWLLLMIFFVGAWRSKPEVSSEAAPQLNVYT